MPRSRRNPTDILQQQHRPPGVRVGALAQRAGASPAKQSASFNNVRQTTQWHGVPLGVEVPRITGHVVFNF